MPTIDKRDTDTPRSYAALLDYAAMGAGRSLRDLAAHYRRQSVDGSSTTPPSVRFETLGTWSKANDWQARVAAYDAEQRAAEEAQRAEVRTRRRAELENLDWEQATALRSHLSSLLAELPRFLRRSETETTVNGERVKVITLALNTSPGELARAMKLASEVQRLSVGQATEQIDSNQTIEIRYVNDPIDDEAPAPGTAEDYE